MQRPVYARGMDALDPDAEAFAKEVGVRLRTARNAAGLSLQAAANHLGLKSRAAVGHWETGLNPIDIGKLRRLARLYRTTVVSILADQMTNEDLIALTTRQLQSATAAKEPSRKQTGTDG